MVSNSGEQLDLKCLHVPAMVFMAIRPSRHSAYMGSKSEGATLTQCACNELTLTSLSLLIWMKRRQVFIFGCSLIHRASGSSQTSGEVELDQLTLELSLYLQILEDTT